MARRTITFAEGIEYGVRERQIEMMRQQKRDVPFTEAVNWVLLQGLYCGAKSKGVSDEDLGELCAKWTEGIGNISMDAFLDNIPSTSDGERPSLPSK